MKKQIISKLLLALITASLLLSGCGAEETDGSVETSQVEVEQEEEGKIEGIHVTEGAKYQYQVINPEDIIIEYSGLKSDIALSEYDGSYVTDTSVYLSDTVGVYLGEEHFEAKVSEYVHYTDVNFKWNVSDEDLYLLWRKDLEVSPSLFEGSITYADGYVGSIDADEVELKYDGYVIDVIITLRGDDRVGYQVEISEAWLDLNEERLLSKDEEEIAEWYEGLGGDSSVIDESNTSGSVTQVNDDEPWSGLYSVKDAPGLINIDWNAFNGYMYAEQMSFLGDVNLEINVLQVLGSDPRINNDWSELNDKFSALYGNGDKGLAKFANDLARSYDYSVDFARGFCDYAYIVVEPYRTNTDNGVYGVINELEITDKEAYDAFYGAREQEAEDAKEQAEQNRWNSLTPEEQQAELYDKEMSTYYMSMSNLVMELSSKGIYTEEVWSNFESEYDALDWLISNGYLSDPDGKYKESIDWHNK